MVVASADLRHNFGEDRLRKFTLAKLFAGTVLTVLDSLSLDDGENTVNRRRHDLLFGSAWPMNFYLVNMGTRTDAEVWTRIAGG